MGKGKLIPIEELRRVQGAYEDEVSILLFATVMI